ncbi:phosphoglycerate mutase-like protein 1 isoform X1 [Cucumis melo var. makuwa]|uniref:Phosphoglycerate mutase-like protein 1 isoform X1 n=1 Tax=Cucumis melo var. makuwa TaxID=1194695 RepID=A0A5A7T5A9_CUCMM|nr:phosphoglycerate mutase-like protein 1 isoform X1 [Cucumis melo var. makuwa]TYK31245.1 phosphoglycerate mutase-like protein 1 isoform X1 [Cucumis melo var. makuwa]
MDGSEPMLRRPFVKSCYENPIANFRTFFVPLEGLIPRALFRVRPFTTLFRLPLVRHGQGHVAGDKEANKYQSFDCFDAQLTSLGWKQVSPYFLIIIFPESLIYSFSWELKQVGNLRRHVQSCGLSKRIELVVTSPLFRTMQTAVGAFGGEVYSDDMHVPPLMVQNAGDSNCPAISSLNCPPFLAVELCREHLGVNPCDKRRSISECRSLFPAIDFSMASCIIEQDEDILWTSDIRETNGEVADRGLMFLKWLWTRKEKEIAIVSHCGFLFHVLSVFGNDCHRSVEDEICKHRFANCELRSFVLVDWSTKGSESSTTNFSRQLSNRLDLPSDVAAEKHPRRELQMKMWLEEDTTWHHIEKQRLLIIFVFSSLGALILQQCFS